VDKTAAREFLISSAWSRRLHSRKRRSWRTRDRVFIVNDVYQRSVCDGTFRAVSHVSISCSAAQATLSTLSYRACFITGVTWWTGRSS